ncbi:Mog1p/PsbP-like protein [Lentithecium fluviatile CBS 122367]|uniref:Mog1p/PsbP-like protein n=1 Tax=Lentithecium fluviatile CBS 122367 TaxID=1168545 RepID=A0A6G1ILT7_9PLEO|nr:Mog1p/PsbP-like protein [Lentithecium fluviatile CBS 122367]
MVSFKHVELYGGAITTDLPESYGDVSQIRQVPDHQEVYLDTNGYSGIISEILQYVDKPTDLEALQYHFADLVDGTGDSTNVLGQGNATMEKVPGKPVFTLSFIQTPPAPEHPGRKQPEFVAIHLLLLRLKEKGTDILITINAPHYKGEYEKPVEGETVTGLMRDGEEIRERILATFEVQNWGLFDA